MIEDAEVAEFPAVEAVEGFGREGFLKLLSECFRQASTVSGL